MSSDISHKQTLIISLIANCARIDPTPDCVLAPLRQFHLQDADKFVCGLSESDLDKIIQCHKDCLIKGDDIS